MKVKNDTNNFYIKGGKNMTEQINKEQFIGNGLSVVSKQTMPPARYTEASLVKELQERGVGRP